MLLFVTVELLVFLLEVLDLSLQAAFLSDSTINIKLSLSILGSQLLVRLFKVAYLCFSLLEFDSCLRVITGECLVFHDLLLISLL